MRAWLLAVAFAMLHTTQVQATVRLYPDIKSESSNGLYRVEATSPDNADPDNRGFQARFTYRCVNTKSEKILWTRKQPMGLSDPIDGDAGERHQFPEEASPRALYVSDLGTTVIFSGWNDLVVVSLAGHETGKIDLLDDAMPKEERKKYVHWSTAGPLWTGLSAWYFFQLEGKEYFVVRPWWGRRIIVDTATAKQARTRQSLLDAAVAKEKKLVMSALTGTPKSASDRLSLQTAGYLAGRLEIEEAVPLLRKLEESDYQGSCTWGGLSLGEDQPAGVDPHSYCTYTHRQVAQLSLRRLGVSPRDLPSHSFQLVDDGKERDYVIPKRLAPRSQAASCIAVGMTAIQVLQLLGSPDFISRDTWEYDIEGRRPLSLVLTFDARKVTTIRKTDPQWLGSLKRDEQLAY